MLSPRALHDLRFFLLGIRAPELVQQAWDEHQAKKKAACPKRRRR
ncbi:hypothetical protein VT84_24400 [Gemmata sp. SH-PL17]|nr:hypothetical protein [Gemmata sp. SH-PL17]AMV27565.1 hypothetical protein VT84_24400 [Gemmata sp. SH-PL17]